MIKIHRTVRCRTKLASSRTLAPAALAAWHRAKLASSHTLAPAALAAQH